MKILRKLTHFSRKTFFFLLRSHENQDTTKGVARIFDWGGANHQSHAMALSQTSKEEFFMGQRYRRIEDQKTWPRIDTQLGTSSRRGLKSIVKMRKWLNWKTRLGKEVYCNLNVAAKRFFVSFWKKKLLEHHWITFGTYSEPFESSRFLTFKNQLKKFNCLFLLLLAL